MWPYDEHTISGLFPLYIHCNRSILPHSFSSVYFYDTHFFQESYITFNVVIKYRLHYIKKRKGTSTNHFPKALQVSVPRFSIISSKAVRKLEQAGKEH